MVAILSLLLLFSVAALVGLSIYCLQLHGQVAQSSVALATHEAQFQSQLGQQNAQIQNVTTQYQALAQKYNEDVKKWQDYSTKLKTENQHLARWKGIADADAKAAGMMQSAQAAVAHAAAEANSIVFVAQQRASTLQMESERRTAAQSEAASAAAKSALAEAREKAQAQKEEAQGILSSASSQAAKIIENANKKAGEIAGSAYDAMNDAALYERTAKAMKNIIEGYGNQYIIPEQSLLDELAEDFSFAKAGQELKRAREYTKVMIRNVTAAACDYVEENRRETAINFIIDAFNGKVDSILSRTKHDNAGKLEQQIRDAFTLVNFNGKPFRDARITDEFLAARLDELKWAEIANQLAIQEREEQRYAKELAREEARAIKEQERALREAAKEEEMLRKAMEQAKEQFEHASGAQKAMYEERLRSMNERLTEALERKERARSMAEQTKKGHVYIISNIGSLGEDVFKIGLTRRDDPFDRIRELGDSSVPFEYDVHAMILSDDAPKLERLLHEHFLLRQVNKVNPRKEFFRATIQEIRDEIERLGITTGVKWTMAAQARDYRESIAIDEAIKKDAAKREAWINRQLQMEDAAARDELRSDASEVE